jgi:SAM-dependent methyltransferase
LKPLVVDLGSGPVAADENDAFSRFTSLLAAGGLVVLEVGGNFDPSVAAAAGIAGWIAIDPLNTDGVRPPAGRTIRGSAHQTGLPAASVDAVFSCNALQHIHPLAEMFAELHRVMRPGALGYLNFGPVWSAPDGSHVEGFCHGGKRYDFWSSSLLPPWSHLVLSASELGDLLGAQYGAAFGRELSHWVHTTTWLNRIPLHRLLEIVTASPLRPLSIRGTREFGYSYQPPLIAHPLAERLHRDVVRREAFARHGIPERHLDVRDIELVVERPR